MRQITGIQLSRINAQLRRRNPPELDTSGPNAAATASLIFHSLAARYAEVLHVIENLSGHRFTHLYLVGGGSQNTLLNRLTEQATRLKIRATEAESSTLGNFAIQLATLERNDNSSSKGNTATWARRLKPSSNA